MDDSLNKLRSGMMWPRRGFITRIAAAPVLLLAAPAIAENNTPSGTVQISQTQIAFVGSANLGGGRLNFGGKSYPFTIGGLGFWTLFDLILIITGSFTDKNGVRITQWT